MFFDFDSVFSSRRFPELDITENSTEFHITADVPRTDRKTLKVTTEGDHTICFSGTRLGPKLEDGSDYTILMRERMEGFFQRCISLPKRISTEKITAQMSKDDLVVIAPKVSTSNQQGSVSIVESQ